MNDISPNWLKNLTPDDIGLLLLVARTAESLPVRVVLIGAKAIECTLSGKFDLPVTRATRDIDFAVRVNSWETYGAFKSRLEQANLRIDPRRPHRLRSGTGGAIDLIPYGGIEDPPGKIRWRDDPSIEMTVIGLAEADATGCSYAVDGDTTITVVGIACFAALKLAAWLERRDERDVQDFGVVLRNYLDAGNTDRLYADAADLIDEDFDNTVVSARLLGRDMRTVASAELGKLVDTALTGALTTDHRFLAILIRMPATTRIHEDETYVERCLEWCLREFRGLVK